MLGMGVMFMFGQSRRVRCVVGRRSVVKSSGRREGRGDVVGQRHVARGAEAADVGAMLVFDPEERPHAAAGDF